MRRPSERRPVRALATICLLALYAPGASADAIRSAPRQRTDPLAASATPAEAPERTGRRSDPRGERPGPLLPAQADILSRPLAPEPDEVDDESTGLGSAPAPEAEDSDPRPRPDPPAYPLPGEGPEMVSDAPTNDGRPSLPPHRPASDRLPTPDRRPSGPARGGATAIEPPASGASGPGVNPAEDAGFLPPAPEDRPVGHGFTTRSPLENDHPMGFDTQSGPLASDSSPGLLPGRVDDRRGIGPISDDTLPGRDGAVSPSLPGPDASFAWDTADNLDRLLDSSYGAELRRSMFEELAPDPVLIVSRLAGEPGDQDDRGPSVLTTASRTGGTVSTPEPSSLILIGLAALIAVRHNPRRRRSSAR